LIGPSGLYTVSAAVAAVGYLLLDVYTKIVFYIELGHRKDQSDTGFLTMLKKVFS